MSKIFMPFEIKMEIFKLFSPEWAVINPEKMQRARGSTCNCFMLNQQLQEKNKILSEFEKNLSDLQTQLDEYLVKEKDDIEKVENLKEINKEYFKLLFEYDDIASNITGERDTFKSTIDLLEMHLANLEFSFSDLHSKFERAKCVVDGFKKNEEVLLGALKDNEDSILELHHRYNLLKNNSEMKLQEANDTVNKMKDNYENEIIRRDTKIKRQEIKINSLENSIRQKSIENEKLSSICDDFIYKQKEIL